MYIKWISQDLAYLKIEEGTQRNEMICTNSSTPIHLWLAGRGRHSKENRNGAEDFQQQSLGRIGNQSDQEDELRV
jgi:hypothetical protein